MSDVWIQNNNYCLRYSINRKMLNNNIIIIIIHSIISCSQIDKPQAYNISIILNMIIINNTRLLHHNSIILNYIL